MQRVLIGVGDATRTLELARTFASHGFIPAIALEPAHAAHAVALDEYALFVVDDEVHAAMDAALSARPDPPVLLLASAHASVRSIDARSFILPASVSAPVVVLLAQTLMHTHPDVVAPAPRTEAHDVRWGPLRLDLRTRLAWWQGESLHLTAAQFDLLHTLAGARGGVITTVDLQQTLWPDEVPDDGLRLMAHVRRIRAKIEPEPSRPQWLLTVRGQGFRLRAAPT